MIASPDVSEQPTRRRKLITLLRGEWLPDALTVLLNRPYLALLEALLLFVLGGLLTLRSSDIQTANSFWLPWKEELVFAFWPSFFWVLLLSWIVFFFLRRVARDLARSESEAEYQRQAERLHRAILRSPSPNLVKTYKDYIARCDARLRSLPLGEETEKKERLRGVIHSILRVTIEMAREFAGNPPRAQYSANIMLSRPPDVEEPPYPEDLLRRLRFFDVDRMNIRSLKGLLFIDPGLIVAEGRVQTSAIALPVPQQAQDEATGRILALPGAPYAFLEGQMSVYESTKRFMEWCEQNCDFSPSVLDGMERYFNADEGKYIGSFLSVRIGTEKDPVGVLNLDSTEENLLGTVDEEYFVTFEAFLSPILILLAPVVSEYYISALEEE